ncbi:MAG: cyclic peptide export ABC transporter [Psychrosphaera sp.]|nr:cyclic peptide export ABC transporter [Psychrosphaera sp.]
MLGQIIQRFKIPFIFTALFSAMGSFASIAILAMISEGVNAGGVDEVIAQIPLFILAVLVLFIISWLSQWLLAKLGVSLVYELRTVLMRRVLNADHENLERIGGHRVHATVTTDVDSIAQSFAILPLFIVNMATVIFCSIYLSYLSVPMFLVLMFGLGLGVVMSIVIMKKGQRYFYSMREAADGLFNAFKTMVDGSKELSINDNRRFFFFNKQALPSAQKVRDTELKARFYMALNESFGQTVLFIALGIVVYFWYIFDGVDKVILTNFVLFTTYLVGPLAFMISLYQPVIKGRVSYQKIVDMRLTNDETPHESEVKLVEDNWKAITLTNVSYQYPKNADMQFGIGPLNFDIKQGEILFVRGGNGSGKSTFAKTLVGLYHPQEGHISIAGEVVDKTNMQWYRRHFATVFSDFHLFEHVLDAKGDLVSTEAIQGYLKKLDLVDKVKVVDGKLSTTNLSMGQRKRLAMLLAYAEDAQIYLFDEWAADQDPHFRHFFYTELLPELKSRGKTVVAITHDEKYFYCADRMVWFDSGKAEFEAVEHARQAVG